MLKIHAPAGDNFTLCVFTHEVTNIKSVVMAHMHSAQSYTSNKCYKSQTSTLNDWITLTFILLPLGTITLCDQCLFLCKPWFSLSVGHMICSIWFDKLFNNLVGVRNWINISANLLLNNYFKKLLSLIISKSLCKRVPSYSILMALHIYPFIRKLKMLGGETAYACCQTWSACG